MSLLLLMSLAAAAVPVPVLSLEPAMVAVVPVEAATDRPVRALRLYMPTWLDGALEAELPGRGEGPALLAVGSYQQLHGAVVQLGQLSVPASDPAAVGAALISLLSTGRPEATPCGEGCSLFPPMQHSAESLGVVLQPSPGAVRLVFAQTVGELDGAWLLAQAARPGVEPRGAALGALFSDATLAGVWQDAERAQAVSVSRALLAAQAELALAPPDQRQEVWARAEAALRRRMLSLMPDAADLRDFTLRRTPAGLQVVGDLSEAGRSLPRGKAAWLPVWKETLSANLEIAGDPTVGLARARAAADELAPLLRGQPLRNADCMPDCDLLRPAQPWAFLDQELLRARPVPNLDGLSGLQVLLKEPTNGAKVLLALSFSRPRDARAALAAPASLAPWTLLSVPDAHTILLGEAGQEALELATTRRAPAGFSLWMWSEQRPSGGLLVPGGMPAQLSLRRQGSAVYLDEGEQPHPRSRPLPPAVPSARACQIELLGAQGQPLQLQEPLFARCAAQAEQDIPLRLLIGEAVAATLQAQGEALPADQAASRAARACASGLVHLCE